MTESIWAEMWISVPVHPGKYDCAAGIKNWKKGAKQAATRQGHYH